jgi:hypothetical protein
MADLEVDEKRVKAIEAMVEMANDAKAAGQGDMAKGFFSEAARLMEAHAENADGDDVKAQRMRRAEDYRLAAQGRPAPTGSRPAAASNSSGGSGDWEVTWTRGGDEGVPQSGPAGGWEPFAIALDSGTPIVGWRRRP